jgi:pimeloyl-ACP methyl ester carboxylesterase
MRRRWTIAVGIALTLVVLFIINALIVDGETEGARVTVPGGRILDLPDGEMQVLERGPRRGSPIVLVHCFSCAIDWWDRMLPMLERKHRVIAIDLLGHGGSEKPGTGYTPENQGLVVAEVLERLDVKNAEVVGHSLGGSVAVALAQDDPELVERVAIIDMPPDNSYGDLGFIASLAFQPVIGEALWQIKPDFSIRDGLGVAFAPGFDAPDAFVEDVRRLTYTAYDDSPSGVDDYLDEGPLDQRMKETGKPLMVLMGAEEQIVNDPRRALAQYKRGVPSAQVHLIQGAGHSPNVEKPRQTAHLVLEFARKAQKQVGSSVRDVTEHASASRQGTPRNVP